MQVKCGIIAVLAILIS